MNHVKILDGICLVANIAILKANGISSITLDDPKPKTPMVRKLAKENGLTIVEPTNRGNHV